MFFVGVGMGQLPLDQPSLGAVRSLVTSLSQVVIMLSLQQRR